jgi:phosphoadenosine phosphosulfate reductase
MTALDQTPELIAELLEANARFETGAPSQILTWAHERFGDDLAFACSFQDIVLLDLAVGVMPQLEIIFLDTKAHFQETWDYLETARTLYPELKVTITQPDDGAIECGQDGCCAQRKVAPLRTAVSGKAAWITSLKRVDAPTRQGAPIVAWDDAFGLVKINPLATWTDDDVASYEQSHHLPIHPLIPQGYLSIGCAPTTKPVAPGQDPRSGRWAGSDKVECGLHEA